MKYLLCLLAALHSDAFTANRCIQRTTKTSLNAADGAPQYDKFQATLRDAEKVGDGSFMLHIDTNDVVEYEPGHVLALEIEAPKNEDDSDSKFSQDTNENGGWIRGPYTVSRATDKSIDILIKVVGEKSKLFSCSKPGSPLQFGGKFKVPILDGIDADTTKRVVLISTGVGAGPCIGAIEKALEQESFPPIELLASYRTEEDVVYKDHLNKLQKEHADKFSWQAIITSEQGRISSTTENSRMITDTKFSSGLEDTHYHLIGNGQMVSEFKTGLEKAGVKDDKVTLEMYFNHRAEVDADAVSRISEAFYC